jgi:hypothetical protein
MQIPDDMLKYINSLENPHRRDYATKYSIWITRSEADKDVPEPTPWHVSCTGAMMIRQALHTIQGSEVRHPERGGFKLYEDGLDWPDAWFQTLEEAQEVQAIQASKGKVLKIASLTEDEQLYINYWWPFLFV